MQYIFILNIKTVEINENRKFDKFNKTHVKMCNEIVIIILASSFDHSNVGCVKWNDSNADTIKNPIIILLNFQLIIVCIISK